MKHITRTITTTTVYPKIIVVKNGKLTAEDKPEFKLDGEPKETEIIKACRKLYGKLNNYIFETESEEKRYRMTVEEFMAHAKEVDETDEDEGIADEDYDPENN